MSVPQAKAELLLAIDKNFSKLVRYLSSIPPEITSDKSMNGHAKGTEMSVRDFVSYLLGQNSLVVGGRLESGNYPPLRLLFVQFGIDCA